MQAFVSRENIVNIVCPTCCTVYHHLKEAKAEPFCPQCSLVALRDYVENAVTQLNTCIENIEKLNGVRETTNRRLDNLEAK